MSVNALNPNDIHFGASVTVLTNGTMLVTWMKADFASGPNNGQHIYAKAFNVATGAALSTEFRLDSSGATGAAQDPPSVTALASGGWVATWTNTIGDPELITVWTDPEFDPAQEAFYYAKVIEIPTPRWTAYEALRFGVKMTDDVPMTTQERAYTSPIWYTPAG